MKIDIAVNGRFHMFDLAKELNNKKCLNKIITTYPKWKVQEWGIVKDAINSIVFIEVLKRLKKYYPKKITPFFMLKQKELFDRISSRYISNSADIFVGLSTNCLYSLKKAKSNNITTIVECGSTHVLHQKKVFSREYKKCGVEYIPTHEGLISRAIEEYSAADYISVPSKHVMRTFVDYGVDKNKIICNPYGVDLSGFYNIDKCDDKFRVVACGAVSLFRGAHYLIEAFYKLNMKNAELCFIGGIREEMLVFINKYKHKNIKFLGHKPQNELYKYYSQGSLLCITSMDEGLAMVIPQAMACGLAIFATDNTGADEMVKDGVEGKIIDSFSVDSIQKALLWAYNNQDEVSRMGLRAKNTVSSGLSWHDYGDRIYKKYEEILSKKRQIGNITNTPTN